MALGLRIQKGLIFLCFRDYYSSS